MDENIANLNIERGVLSAFIFDPEYFHSAAKRINKDYFFLAAHKNIFDAMITLSNADKPIDEIFISQELSRAGQFDEKVLVEILTTNGLTNEEYINELARYKDRRVLENLSIQFKKAANSEDPVGTAKLLISELETSISIDKRLPHPQNHENIIEKDAEFILNDWLPIPKNTVSLITAPGGSGKSWIVLQIAARFCLSNNGGSAFLWLSEDPLSLSKSRLNKILADVVKASGKGLKIDIADDPTPFILQEQHRRLGVDPIWHELKKLFEPYSLIILDPLIAFFGADENNNAHARYFMQLFTDFASKYNKTIIFIHHSTKGTTGSRGAGAFVDAVRCVYEVDRIKTKDGTEYKLDESKTHMRLIKLSKDNYGAGKLLGGIEVQRQIFPESKKISSAFEIAFAGEKGTL
jgi:replicative DNA helicase